MLLRVNFGLFPLITILIAFAIVIMGLVIHNIIQASLAYHYGDASPKEAGFFSFDPRQHIGVISLITVLLLGIGWTKSIELDKRQSSITKQAELIIWYGGPVIFLVLSMLCHLLSAIFTTMSIGVLNTAFAFAGYYLLIHAVTHLVPIWPLDGARGAMAFGNQSVNRLINQTKGAYPLGLLAYLTIVMLLGIGNSLLGVCLNIIDALIKMIG